MRKIGLFIAAVAVLAVASVVMASSPKLGKGNPSVPGNPTFSGTTTFSGTAAVTGVLKLPSKTEAQMRALTPAAVGQVYYVSDSVVFVCVSTGTAKDSFASFAGGDCT